MTSKLFQFISLLYSSGPFRGGYLLWQKLFTKFSRRFALLRYFYLERKYIQTLRKKSNILLNQMAYKPLFSIIMPVYNIDEKWLKRAIESVRKQIYPYWELCIADDASTRIHVREVLNRYSKLDTRIKVIFREKNGGISAASNSALEMATGDYVVILDHDDELAPHALYENAKLINRYPEADYIYSDRDLIDTNQKRFRLAFKPDWSPQHFYACMYTFHLGVFRTTLIRQLNGFCSDYDGAQDYDLALKVIEKTKNIFHIHKVLYHWRTLPTSLSSGPVKKYAFMASVNAVQASLDRRGIKAKVKPYNDILGGDYHQVDYEIIGNPLVSIIIINSCKILQQKHMPALQNCLQAVIEKTSYKNWEVIVVDGSGTAQVVLDKIALLNDFKLVPCDEHLNFPQQVNLAAGQASGDYLLLLDDDTEPINSEWLESLLQLAQLEEVGAVGAKLIFPDHTLNHVGIVIPDVQKFYYGYPYYRYSDSYSGYCNFCKIVRNYIAVTKACLMVKRSSFEKVGGLNEDLPYNYNDIEFCLKLHRAGYHNVYTPYARLYHYECPSREPVQAWEVAYMQAHWSDYMQSLGGYDPYYNLNFSPHSANFEL